MVNYDSTINIILQSGGLDSTYLVYKMLIEQKYPIHIHHMYLKRIYNIQKAERNAIKKALPILKKYGQFEYSETIIDLRTTDYIIMDFYYQQLDVFNLGMSLSTKYDMVYVYTANRTLYDLNMRYEAKRREYQAVLSRGTKLQYKILQPFTKDRVYYSAYNIYQKLLPKNLRDKQQSCRRPIDNKDGTYSPCYCCPTCEKHIREGVPINEKM